MKQISDNSLEELGFRLPSNAVIKKLLFSYLRINKMNELLGDQGPQTNGVNFIEEVFKKLNINYKISDEDLRNIPQTQPFIILSNHPFGFLDGLIMLHLVGKQRPDFKVMANFFLKQFKALEDSFIELNPFETKNSQNYRGMRLAYQHLRDGHPVGLFPAGEVATMQKRLSKIEDKAWDTSIIRFILNANVPIIPMYFEGNNSLFFHLIGKLHPRLRTPVSYTHLTLPTTPYV
jgi:putative hemolysin